MGRHGDGEMEKYLVMIEDRTFFYTELNGFDIIGCALSGNRHNQLWYINCLFFPLLGGVRGGFPTPYSLFSGDV